MYMEMSIQALGSLKMCHLDSNQFKVLENSFVTVNDSIPMLSDIPRAWLIYVYAVKELPRQNVESSNL